MGLNPDDIDGQTPLDEDEREELKIKSISLRSELDEFEQQSIEKAMLWLRSKKLTAAAILSEKFVKELHRRMYADVWKWAGHFRAADKNTGIPKNDIAVALKQLLDDTRYRIENQTFPPAEIAIRFKHRLVQVHCFANGNGRHSRLITDTLMEKHFALPPFTWGAASLIKHGNTRNEYIKALRKADAGDYTLLLAFAMS